MKDILIVEDGMQDRQRLQKLLSDHGYSVMAASSVTEGEKALEIQRFRLAILDIGLGDKSGSLLFDSIRKSGKVSNIIIFTGNPSVHLKQRFISSGAVDYVVKGSSQAQNQNFLDRVIAIIGAPTKSSITGINLDQFIRGYLGEASIDLFLDSNNELPPCKGCGGKEYLVDFNSKPQMPPQIVGEVLCGICGLLMDPEVS